MGYFGITGSTPSIEIKNDTSTMGYAGLQLMKGKVIVIDNEVDGTRNMIIKNKYVLAHTSDLSLTRFNPNQPIPNRNNNADGDQQNNNQNQGANDNMNLGANDMNNGYQSGQNTMSQVVSVRDNPNRLKDIKKHLLDVVKDQAQSSQFYADHIYPSSELIFLQSQSNFIEKTLGIGEKMKVRSECLVAHANTVKVNRTPVNDFEFNQRG